MRIIVVGAGEVGYHVAERLSNEKHEVTVVDTDADRLDYVQSHLDVAVVQGSGASPAVLEAAGVRQADLIIAVTSVDEVNLVSCLTARRPELVTVARVSNPDFFTGGAHLDPERFGVNVMINPERELAFETFRLLQSTAATDVADFAGGAVQLVGLRVTDDAPVVDRTLADVSGDIDNAPMLTVAIIRDGKTIVPTGMDVVRKGDLVYVVTATDEIPRALELCGHERAQLKRVMIAGGSHEAFYLGELLGRYRVQATLVVSERNRAQELAEKLPKALVLNADATDVELLEMEGVGDVDAFAALTEADETNILASLLAEHVGARQVVTLVNRVDYMPLARRIGLNIVVSPRLSAANAILRHVRRGSVTRVATLKESDAEVISFNVTPASPVIGRPLAEAQLPDGTIVATIVRDQQVIVPRGGDVLQAGDVAIVFALPDKVQRVTDLFPS